MYEEKICSYYKYKHLIFLQCLKKMNIRYFNPFRLTDPFRRWHIYGLLLARPEIIFWFMEEYNCQKSIFSWNKRFQLLFLEFQLQILILVRSVWEISCQYWPGIVSDVSTKYILWRSGAQAFMKLRPDFIWNNMKFWVLIY